MRCAAIVPDNAFTDAEVEIELERMARERLRNHLLGIVLNLLIVIVSVANLTLFMLLRQELWPVWVEAMSKLPGSPMLHWQLVRLLFVFGIVVGIIGSVILWKTRELTITNDTIITAMVRLTRRGGL